MIEEILYSTLLSAITVISILLAVAFFTLAERKVMGAMQRRYGPNVVGIWGLLQPIADGIKLVFKEVLLPTSVSRGLYLLAPSLMFMLSFLNWCFIPFSYGNYIIDFNYSLLYLYLLMSLSVYGIILAGWISNSRYAFIGAVRAVAQMLSYEVVISFVFLIIIMHTQSSNIIDIVYVQHEICWFVFVLLPIFIIFCISILAETNRIPFDLPEAEAELVAGYNLEYSGLPFAFFFLAEYANMLFNSMLVVLLFLGGWHSIFDDLISPELTLVIKCLLVWFTFINIRATYPRYRFDQLITIGWTVLFPLIFFFMLFYIVCGIVFTMPYFNKL